MIGRHTLTAALAGIVMAAACAEHPLPTTPPDAAGPQLGIRLETDDGAPGPPYYTPIQPGWFPMTSEWAAIPFLRQPSCVPDDFNLLTLLDLTIVIPPGAPRPFLCPLTVREHEIWNTDPPNPAIGPLNVVAKGLGAVPIYFIRTTTLRSEIGSDDILTIADLEALMGTDDLLVGHASQFTLTNQLGGARGRPGTGKINITARGTLEDGRTFFFQTAEGPPYKEPIAHTRIDFR